MIRKIIALLQILTILCFSACKKDNPLNTKVTCDFQASDSLVDLNQSISFTDQSQGNPTSWTWEFEGGNPSVSHEQNPAVLYENAGIYDVKLTVQNGISIDSVIRKKYIIVENSTSVTFDLTWQTFPGTYTNEVINSFIKTTDGGYMSCGWIWISPENTDACIVKYNENLEVVWQKIYSGDKFDDAGSLIETSDGDYLIAGATSSTEGEIMGTHGGYDAFLLKIDDSGNIVWQKSYGGSEDEYCGNKSLIELPDHHIMISASSGSTDGEITSNHGGFDLWVVNLDSNGEIQWEKCYGGTLDEYGRQIMICDQGTLIGLKNNSNDGDFPGVGNVVAMIDQSGTIQWKTNLGGMNYGKTILDRNGGFISLNANNARYSDIEVVGLSGSGSVIWKSSFGGSRQEFGNDIIQLEDGSLIVLGLSSSTDGEIPGNYGSEDDLIISKLSASGKLLGIRNFGGSSREWANCILNQGNWEYLIDATTTSDDFDVSGNVNGNSTWLFKVRESSVN
jgi:PKD repeat protein